MFTFYRDEAMGVHVGGTGMVSSHTSEFQC